MKRTYYNPTNPATRLLLILCYVCFPTPLRFAAVVAGLTDQQACEILADSPDYVVSEGQIYHHTKEWSSMEQEAWEKMTLHDADRMYKEMQWAIPFADGQPQRAVKEELEHIS